MTVEPMSNIQTPAQRLATLAAPHQRLCVGIDPHPATLHDWGVADSPLGLEAFFGRMISACLQTGVSIIKPQVALFERHGPAGMAVLAEAIGRARHEGLLVIADAKRGDIGTSLAGYSHAWLAPGADFESDALTLNPYLGLGALEPAFDMAREFGKIAFALAATSNPEALTVQSATTSHGESVAQSVLLGLQRRLRDDSFGEPSHLGAVVGATGQLEARRVNLGDCPDVWVLAPGFGHQGAPLDDVGSLFGSAVARVIPAVSRSVAGDHPDGVETRITQHVGALVQNGGH